MTAFDMIVTESDHARFSTVLDQLAQECNAKFAFLLDKAGQQIASSGNLDEIDPTSLASLTAGNVAATEGVAQLVGENEFTTLFHEGKNENLHINLIGRRVILLIVFDERSSVGLVRLRVEKAVPELSEIVEDMTGRSGKPESSDGGTGGLGEITSEDIEALFG